MHKHDEAASTLQQEATAEINTEQMIQVGTGAWTRPPTDRSKPEFALRFIKHSFLLSRLNSELFACEGALEDVLCNGGVHLKAPRLRP